MTGINPIQALTLGADAAYLSRRDPPTASDGHYDWQVDDDGVSSKKDHSIVTNVVGAATTLKGKGVFVPNAKEVVCFFSSAPTTMIEQLLT